MTNLETWLEGHFEQTNEGYTVTNLDEATLAEIEGVQRDLDGLIGAAVGYDVSWPVDDVVYALIFADPMEVFPDTYESAKRQFLTDPDCFREHGCERLDVRNVVTADYPLGLQVVAQSRAQYRWVELDSGTAMLQRNWLVGEARFNVDFIVIEAQYFESVTLPRPDGTTRRVEAMWVLATLGDTPVPEDVGLSLAVDSMRETGGELDAYLSSQR